MSESSIAFDVPTKYATIGGISKEGEVLVKEDHLPLRQLPTWATTSLTAEDEVALGATAPTPGGPIIASCSARTVPRTFVHPFPKIADSASAAL